MKNQIFKIVVIVLVYCITSCSKYDEGRFSFQSSKKRICQQWQLHAPTGSGAQLDTNYTMIYDTATYSSMANENINAKKLDVLILGIRDDFTFYFNIKILANPWYSFGYNSYTFSGNGTWKFLDHKKKILLTYNPWLKNGLLKNESIFTTGTTEEWEIIQLEKDDLKIKLKYNNLDYVIEKKFQ